MKSIEFVANHKKLFLLLFCCAVVVGFIILAMVDYSKLRWKVRNVVIDFMSEDVAIDGATLSVMDMGKSGPTTIIIGALAASKDGYWDLQRMISKHTRVIAYDRPGIGRSEPNDEARTLDVIYLDLRDLLEEKNLEPPYIFIGHSIGGNIIRYFANLHPDEVAGLVILDQPHEEWFDYVRAHWSPEDSEPYFQGWKTLEDRLSGVARQEFATWEENNELIKGTKIDPDIPVLMITGFSERFFREDERFRILDETKWIEMQAQILDGVIDAKHIVDKEIGHDPHKDKPDLVASEIVDLIERVRRRSDQ